MTLISNFVIISLIVALFYSIGFLIILTDHAENKCEMTYMFEYPQFVKIELPGEAEFPRYGLYAYSEGKLTERARAMRFEGIPVLFVPGNAGSYKQVRSLASVALRKALNSHVGYHFDFFTVDLNDELSGLNGAVLEEQTQFLNHSLYKVLDLYNKTKSNYPQSVIVIGHSMGGVVAHSLLIDQGKFPNIELLITLASPHRRPTICLDSYTAEHYKKIEHNSKNSSVFINKTIISIAGGYNDLMVNSWLTNFNETSLNVATTTIPTVWLTTDHACIVWCKQLVLTLVRALFDSVDLKTKQLSSDHNYRLATFNHYLLKNSGTNIRWAERYKVITKLDDKGQWNEDIRRQYSINLARGTKSNQWHMIRIIDSPKHQALFVHAVNLRVVDWVFACAADNIRGQGRYCENGIHLSHLSKIAPSSSKIKRRSFYVDLLKLKRRYPKITHVAVRIMPTQEPVIIKVDVHQPQDRIVSVNLPKWFSLSRTIVINQTEPEALRYEIQLNGLQQVSQSYLLYVEPVGCRAEIHHASASFAVPWTHHDTQAYFTETSKKPLQLRVHSSRPLQSTNMTAKVILTLDPLCQYSISVRNSFFGMLGQFAKHYSPMLVANVAAVILMSYRSQLMSMDEHGYCSLFQTSLSMSTKPYYLITSVKLLSRLLSWSRFSKILPIPDTQILIDENLDFLILPLLLYVTSVGLTYLLTIGLWLSIILSESTVHRFVAKFITRTVGGAVKWSDWLLNALHRVPCVVAATLLALGITTCGGLALCLGVAYYFLKLTQLCQDYLEGLAYGYVKAIAYKLIRKVFKNFKKPKPTDESTNIPEQNTEVIATEQKPIEIEQNKEQTQIETEQKQIETEQKQIETEQKQTETEQKQIETEQKQIETEQNQIETKHEEVKDSYDQIKIDLKDQKSKHFEDKLEEIIGNGTKVEEDEFNSIKSIDIESKTNEIDNEVIKDNEINSLRLRTMEKSTLNTQESKNEETSSNNSKETKDGGTKEEIKEPKKDISFDHSEMHFHFSLFLMFFLVAGLNVPSVLTWAHNFHYNNILRPDPSAIFAIVLCACAIPLWQMELPKSNKRFYKEVGVFVYGMALLCLIYAPIHIYRLSYILTATIAVTILHQLVAPNLPEEESPEEQTESEQSPETDPIALVNDIKTKLE